MATIMTGRFVLADGVDTVVARQVNAGSETRAALTQWATDNNIGANTGGGAVTLPTGILQTVEANTDGTWPAITRADGARILWMRGIDATTNAPLPTTANGYARGDIVAPAPDPSKGEFFPFTGMVFSDEFTNPAGTVSALAGRKADNFAGGGYTVTWDAGKGPDALTWSKTDLGQYGYADLASSGYIWPVNPLPYTTSRRITLDLNIGPQMPGLVIGLHGDNLAQNQVGVCAVSDDAGVTTWSIQSRYPDTLFSTVTLGTLTATAWSAASVTQTGSQITVRHGGQTFTGTIPAAGMAYKPLFGLGAAQYNGAQFNSLRYENI